MISDPEELESSTDELQLTRQREQFALEPGDVCANQSREEMIAVEVFIPEFDEHTVLLGVSRPDARIEHARLLDEQRAEKRPGIDRSEDTQVRLDDRQPPVRDIDHDLVDIGGEQVQGKLVFEL